MAFKLCFLLFPDKNLEAHYVGGRLSYLDYVNRKELERKETQQEMWNAFIILQI